MDVSSSIPLASLSIDRFSHDHRGSDNVQTRPAGRSLDSEIESLFISMMLKQLRESGGGDGLFAGDTSDTLGGLFDQYLGQFLSEQGGLGLTRQIFVANPESGD